MTEEFLDKLIREAELQQKLHKTRLFPASLDFFTSFIGNNSLVILLVLAFFSALAIEIIGSGIFR
jgi:hypothetical protein